MQAGQEREQRSDIFWGELAPCEHLLQLYEDDGTFLDTLESYVRDGLVVGDAVVVICTTRHARHLSKRLRALGVDIEKESRSRRLILMNAESTLQSFVGEDGWPNDDRFYEVIGKILRRARGKENRRVRAFGEMVAVLWDRGQNAATVRLEYLWNRLSREEEFKLFCAYPKAGFTDYALKSLQDICAAHSRVIH